MANSLTNDLMHQLQGQPLQQMSQQLGLAPDETANAVSAALPLLMGALGRNASQPQGAQALFGALQKDHAGLDVGSVLGSALGGGGRGGDILGHVFGAREQTAAQGLGSATGLGGDRANSLMKMLAPVVMAYLAKRVLGGGTAEATPQALGNVLGQEQQQIRQQGGIGGGLLGAVLDRDGDGDADVSDLIKLGGSIFTGGR